MTAGADPGSARGGSTEGLCGPSARRTAAGLGTSTLYASQRPPRDLIGAAQGTCEGIERVELHRRDGTRWEAIRPRRCKVDRTDPGAVQDARDDSRAERHDLRRALRKVWRTDRVTACGKAGARPGGEVVVRHTPAGPGTGPMVGFSGLMACGNVWLCPECAGKVAARRAARVERALRVAVERGGWAVLITFTLRHHDRHPLAALVDGLRKGWRAVRSGAVAQRERRELGVIGVVRSIEITHGVNGWHPHVHALVVFDGQPTPAQMDALARSMFGRWTRAIVRAGLPAPLAEQHGLDVTHLGASTPEGTYASIAAWARYAVKGITGETVLGVVKDAKGTNRSVRELMRDAVIGTRWASDDGRTVVTLDDTVRGLLLEYEAVTKRVKHLTGTAELEKVLGLDVDEATDEEVAAEEADGDDVALIARGYWDDVVEPLSADLAAAGERYGPDGIRRWLDRHHVPWTVPVPGAGRTWASIAEAAAVTTRSPGGEL